MKQALSIALTIVVTATLTVIWSPFRVTSASTTTAANKIAISASDAQLFNQAQQGGSSTQPATLFSSTFNTSTTEDLLMTVNAECGIYTAVGAKGGSTSTTTTTSSSTAIGSVQVWLELDGKPLPTTLSDPFTFGDPNAIDTKGNPLPTAAGNGPVTFCDRAYNLSTGGLTTTQWMTIYDNTRESNSFTWYALNVGNGSHTLVAKAILLANTTNSTLGSCDPSTGCPYTVPAASAIVGQRTMTVEPDHLANSATF